MICRAVVLGHIEICDKCGGDVRIIASIEDPAVIRMILTHLDTKAIHTDLLPNAVPRQGFCLKHSALLVLIGT
jgi:hypothetical protein